MIIWFVHIPRTGGMSLAKFFGEFKNNKNVTIRHRGHEKFSYDVYNELCKNNKVILCTILRNPESHSMSLWSYMKKYKSHVKHHEAFNNKFITWCKNFCEFPYYVKFFGNGDICQAENVLNNFDYIFNTSTLCSDVNKMLSNLGLKRRFNLNINGTSKRAPNNNEIKIIKNVRRDDYELLNRIGFK